MRKYAIFYENGNVVEGGDESDELVEIVLKAPKKWLEAPVDGVQAVLYERDGSPMQWHGVDHYFVLPDGDEIYATNDLGAYLRKHLQGIVKFGLCISQADYEAHVQKMKDFNWKTYQEKIKPYKQRANEKRKQDMD